MKQRPIPAQSSPLTEEDSRKYEVVKELMQSQNKVIVDFAKHLITVSFSAIGVVLALKEKWLDPAGHSRHDWLLGIASVLFLATAVAGTFAAHAYTHRVSLFDHDDADAEVSRIARLRHRLTLLGFGFCLAGTIIVAAVAL